MRTLKLEMQVSADGFVSDASGSVDWMVWSWGDEWGWDDRLRAYHNALLSSSDCLLISRKMAQEGFFDHWARMSRFTDNPQASFAKKVTTMRKLVFSRTLWESEWDGVELVAGDAAATVAKLKSEPGGDMLVYGGATFASSLLSAGLIDELHLFVNPIALGVGQSMFKTLVGRRALKPVGATLFDCGVVVMKYARAA